MHFHEVVMERTHNLEKKAKINFKVQYTQLE